MTLHLINMVLKNDSPKVNFVPSLGETGLMFGQKDFKNCHSTITPPLPLFGIRHDPQIEQIHTQMPYA